jgi:hypothetical protein
MPRRPLAEVFGFPPDNLSPEAERYRRSRLCPYNNKVPSCTKDKANDPLGVCSVRDGSDLAITCPVRFREDWIIAEDAAAFFFRYPGGKTWLVPRIRQWLASLETKPAEFVEPFAGGGIVSLTVAFEQLADSVTMVELDD